MPVELTPSQRAFVEAFVGPANRNPLKAAQMAKVKFSEAGGYLHNPLVRNAIERANMAVERNRNDGMSGKVVDVTLINPYAPEKPRKLEKIREEISEIREIVHERITGRPLKNPVGRPKKDVGISKGNAGISESGELIPAGIPKNDELISNIVKNLENKSANQINALASKPVNKFAALASGDLESNFKKLREELSQHPTQNMQGSAPTFEKLVKKFDEKTKELGDGEIAAPRISVGGRETFATTKVATRYEIKQFLTYVMLDPREDMSYRMQASAALGKSMGLFDTKIIHSEYEAERALAAPTGDAQAHLQQLRDRIADLRAAKLLGQQAVSGAEVVSGAVGEVDGDLKK